MRLPKGASQTLSRRAVRTHARYMVRADESGRSWRPLAARSDRTDPSVRRWRDGSLRAPRWPAPAHQRKWPQVLFWRGRRTPRSRVRAAHLRTSRHVRPSVAEVSELFFDGCNGSGSSVRTPPRSSASEQSAGMTLERHPNWLGRGERPSSSGAVDVRDVRRGGGSHARQIRPRTPPHTPQPYWCRACPSSSQWFTPPCWFRIRATARHGCEATQMRAPRTACTRAAKLQHHVQHSSGRPPKRR